MTDPSHTDPPGAGRRLLLVDDNEATRTALTRFLELKGYTVIAAADGTTALAALAESPPPDYVLTDLQLPDIDDRIPKLAREMSAGALSEIG